MQIVPIFRFCVTVFATHGTSWCIMDLQSTISTETTEKRGSAVLSEDDRNPKRQRTNPRRNWCFTSFDEEPDTDCSWYHANIRYLVYQREICPETSREHWQGYVETRSSVRFTAVRKWLGGRAHIEPRMGSRQQAIEYCKKMDSRKEGHEPKEYGTVPKPGNRTDIHEVAEAIRNGATKEHIYNDHLATLIRYPRGITEAISVRESNSTFAREPRTVKVRVIIGETGIGKSHHVYAKYDATEVYVLDQAGSGRLWFDNYWGQPILLIDEFYGWCEQRVMLRLLDKYPYQPECKGGRVWARWQKVYIISNKLPCEWYKRDLSPALLRRLHSIQLWKPIPSATEPWDVMKVAIDHCGVEL